MTYYFLDPFQDTFKSDSTIARESKIPCKGCGSLGLTIRHGPDEARFCRSCQLKGKLYPDGMGTSNNISSYHRKPVCDVCGKDVREGLDQLRLENPDLNEMQVKQYWSRMIIGDHIIRRADGGTDFPENIQSLCERCNSLKTTRNNDCSNRKSVAV